MSPPGAGTGGAGPDRPDVPGDRGRWRGGAAVRAYLVVLAVSTLVVSRWFHTGTFVATGDMGPFIRRGWSPELTWSWSHQISGAGSATYTIARAFESVLIWVCRSVGLTEYSAQWLFYTCIYGLVAFAVAYLAGAFVHNEVCIVVAGVFGILNGFFLTRLPNPLNIISIGSIALVTGVAVRVAQGRRISPVVAGFALMPTSFLSFNPPMLLVAYAWTVAGTPLFVLLILGRWPALRLLWWFVRAAPWALALNAWWLVPVAQSFTGGGGAMANSAFTDPTNWSWAQVNNLPQNILTLVANWAWFREQYLPFATGLDRPWWLWIRYLLPALAFLTPVVVSRARRRLAITLLGLVLVVVVLAKGLRPPLSGVNLLLYRLVPGFWLFREPMGKLGQLLVCLFGVLLALFLEGVADRLAVQRGRVGARVGEPDARGVHARRAYRGPWARRLLRVAAVVPVVLVLAYPYPLYTGAVIPDSRPSQPSAHVRVPQAWWDVAERIDSDPRPGKVLVLPLDDYYQMPATWGFFGVDSIANLLIRHGVVQTHPDGYYGDAPAFDTEIHGVQTALLAGDLTPVPRLLDVLGVGSVIIRHDLIRGMPNRTFADDRLLAASIAHVPGMHQVQQGMLDLWRVGDGSSPTVRTYQRVLNIPGRPEAAAAVLGTVDSTTAVVTGVDRSVRTTSPVVDDSPAVSADAVYWPVPAVDSGAPSTTVTLPAGRYTLAQRARAAPVLAPRLDTGRLLLVDPTTVLVDGRPLSTRPPLVVPLPGRPVVALRAGTRTVSLDGWGRGSLPHAGGAQPEPGSGGGEHRPRLPAGQPAAPVTVPVGAATPLTLYAPSTRPARVTPYSAVLDCNNYQPRPASELGLRLQLTAARAGTVVRLAARDHAACTTVTVLDAAPGRTYRVRLEYRTVTGGAPQICIVEKGTGGCGLVAQAHISADWTAYEQFVTVNPDATGLQIVLRANAGRRFGPPSVEEYRGLTIDALDTVWQQTVWPPEVPPVQVDLAAGTHVVRVDGGLAGSVLAPFGPLADCFNTDSRTPEQAGLVSRMDIGIDGDTTYGLGAVSHEACIAAAAQDLGASSLYELSLQARGVAVRNPKFCVYLRGPDTCLTLPTVASWLGWTPYQALFSPNPEAVDTSLYLYGQRDRKERQQAQVEYRSVRLRPVAAPTAVVLIRQIPASPPASVRWRRPNPATFPVTVSAPGTTVVALGENFAPGWTIRGGAARGARHIKVQGWMNGWRLSGDIGATLVYSPAYLSRDALYLLPVALGAAAGWALLGTPAVRRRLRAGREVRGRGHRRRPVWRPGRGPGVAGPAPSKRRRR